jgi:hypothetical protein
MNPFARKAPDRTPLRVVLAAAEHTNNHRGLGGAPYREATEDLETARERQWTMQQRVDAHALNVAAIKHCRNEIERMTGENAEHLAAILADLMAAGIAVKTE